MSLEKNLSHQWIKQIIDDFIASSPDNSLGCADGEKAWNEALVGFADGADPIFEDYKSHVGEFHWTPREIFNQIYIYEPVKAEDLALISYILPQTEATKAQHREETDRPGEYWARARIFGEKFNTALQRHLVQILVDEGFPALAPSLTLGWKVCKSSQFFLASRWSQRHAAYAAGLGTFGLCDGLITPRGKAIRAGSIIVQAGISPTPRPYEDHRAYCLFFARGECKECIPKCPVGALSEDGHDKKKCMTFIRQVTEPYVKKNFRFKGYGCGLCQVGVPCESRIPL